MTNIAIFASGSGSNAENIANYFASHHDINIAVIISNKPDAYVHERAKQLGVPSFTFKKSDFDNGTVILNKMAEYQIDFIVLAGFLLKVPHSIMEAFPNSIINIHPALLPKYGGKGMYGDNVHNAVKNAGETETGITIHYINENYDEGDIIYQAMCEVADLDTPQDIANKVHTLEQMHFPKIIEKILRKNSKNISKY
ncbi:MAG TPA: phosphoribosylglycinamide formyltransferase [Bacteroidales bacterium]|nr:phosphoribosylglycinamide formyltransferase [Bacteroidales bacterium]